MRTDFNAFLKWREQAADAYVSGDGTLVDALVPHDGDGSFHSPAGDTVTGARAVADRYLSDARQFAPNGTTRLDILQAGSDGELGFWTGYQVARVQIGAMSEPVDMTLRVTEIFRWMHGEWKLVHRHADGLTPD